MILESINFFKEKLIETYGDDEKFLGASLHLDETKPHINIKMDNFEVRKTYWTKNCEGIVQQVSIEEFNKNRNLGNYWESSYFDLVNGYRHDNKFEKGNIRIMQYNSLS